MRAYLPSHQGIRSRLRLSRLLLRPPRLLLFSRSGGDCMVSKLGAAAHPPAYYATIDCDGCGVDRGQHGAGGRGCDAHNERRDERGGGGEQANFGRDLGRDLGHLCSGAFDRCSPCVPPATHSVCVMGPLTTRGCSWWVTQTNGTEAPLTPTPSPCLPQPHLCPQPQPQPVALCPGPSPSPIALGSPGPSPYRADDASGWRQRRSWEAAWEVHR